MITEVYTVETVRLLDDEEVELRPLSIAKLRKFMRLWNDHIKAFQTALTEVETAEDFDSDGWNDKQFDVLIKMCALGLSSQLQGEKTDKAFISYLEDVLDELTIRRIVERIGNLKLGEEENPNPKAD